MKKMIILAAAIAATAIVNAATVSWSANIAATTGSTSYYAVLVDSSAYASLDAAVTSLMKDGTAADGVMTSGAAVYNSAKGLAVVALQNKTLPAGYDAGETVGYWTIIFDGTIGAEGTAKNYYNTAADNATAAISDAGKLTLQQGAVTSGEWQAIPEPTSGLLLLLGVAGLALKRKRA